MTVHIYIHSSEQITEQVTHVCISMGYSVDKCDVVNAGEISVNQLVQNCCSGDTIVCVSTNNIVRAECVSHNITYIDASLHSENDSTCHDHLIVPNAEAYSDNLSKLIFFFVSTACDERNHMKLERFSQSLNIRHEIKNVSIETKEDFESKCWVSRKLGFVIESCNSDDTVVFLSPDDISESISERLEVVERCIKRNISVYFYNTMSYVSIDTVKNANEFDLYTKIQKLETQTKLNTYHQTCNDIRLNKLLPVFVKGKLDTKINQIIHHLVEEGMTIKGVSSMVGVDYDALCDFLVQRISNIPICHQRTSDNPFFPH